LAGKESLQVAYFETRNQMSFPAPSKLFTPAVTIIIVLMITGFVIATYAPTFVGKYLALSSNGVFSGKVWQLITYPFINRRPQEIIFSGLMILFIGSALERQWRTKSFVALWLVITLGCGLLWVIVSMMFGGNLLGMGTAGCGYGFLATYAILNRGRRVFMLFGTIEAQYLVMIFIVIGLIMSITAPLNLIWISGAGIAYLYVKFRLQNRYRSVDQDSSKNRSAGGFVDID
jgi:membrane associated rhomboid family serine protease